VWFWIAVSGLAIGFVGSEFAMWKSARLSPDSIMRRFYWAGAAFFTLCIFLSQVPDWKDATFGACIFGFCLVLLAFFRSSHIKIGDTIYAAWPSYRRPDRPPALADDAQD
jgi:cell division protein FtsW (lipid II flippase)